MVRLRSASIKSEIFGYASFVDGFSIVGKFHRLLGYSFFSWKNHNGERKYTASVVSPYLAFASLSWSFFAFVMLQDTYRIVFLDVRNGDGKPLRTIDKCILIFYFVRCLGLQLANVSTLVVYSRELDDIVKKMEAMESTFQRPTRLKPTAKFIVLQNVVFSVAALLSIIDEIAEFDGYMQPVHMKALYGVFSLVFAETVSMIGVSWIMYFSRAFASFLRCINEDIESLAVGRPLARSELAAQHSRFCELWYTFERCDKIFSLGLMIGIPLNIINASPWGYFLLTSHESLLNVSLDVLGFITFGAELFALGAYGSAALDEAKKTWDVLTKLLVSQEHTPEVREQIQEFRHTCQNQDFSFSGCGFFKVGPPLIVSIASAIITYTVILYQSDSISSSAPITPPLNATQV